MKLKVHCLISGHHTNEHLEMPEAQHRQALIFILKKYPGLSTRAQCGRCWTRNYTWKVHLAVSTAMKGMKGSELGANVGRMIKMRWEHGPGWRASGILSDTRSNPKVSGKVRQC